MLAVIALVAMIVLDQVVKFLTVSNIDLGGSGGSLIPGVLDLSYTTNTGGGWSILQGNVLFLIVLPLLLCGFIGYLLISKKAEQPLLKWSLVLILGGALGNLIDRITNDMHVVDMFRFTFIDFPIFNVADIFITIGGAMIFIYFLFIYKENGDKKNGKS